MLLPQGRELLSSVLLFPGPGFSHHHPTPMSAAAHTTSFQSLTCALATPLRPRHSHRSFLHQKPLTSLSLRRSLYPPSSHAPVSPNRAASATVEPMQQPQEEEYEAEADAAVVDFDEMSPPVVEHLSGVSAERDMRHLSSPDLEARELEDLPEQWRRSKVAWLCKELPSHKPAGLLKVLNAQRKWITQEDATYVVLHCLRIRENEAAYRVYQWMVRQRWFRFNFALTTKLADYLGKERKFAKCREMFDAIISQGRVPSESTFHVLTVAYLSAPVQGCIDEACGIYNKMIQLGGYRPRISLHNALFRALVSRTGGLSKHYLKQAEFIFHNLVTSELEVHKDIYAGLIWLHSYQDVIDRERIVALREEMRQKGIEETRDVLLSIIRASSKEGDMEETETTWLKLLESGDSIPSQAFVYRMEIYAKAGEPMKSLEIFKGMKEQEVSPNAAAYHKIIEVMTKAKETETAETLIKEFTESGMKPLMPAFLDLMNMYLNLENHDKLELTFSKCLTRCRPNRSMYNIYLESLVKTGNLEKAEGIFNEMHANGTIGANARSCNIILGGYLASDEYVKAEKIYDIICQKKYDIEPHYLEKLEYALSLNRKVVKRRVSMKLDQEQREILIGMLLGGIQIESDEERRNHAIHFEFSEKSNVHSILKMHIHERFYEWLTSSSRPVDEDDKIPHRFSTVAHSYFGFFASQFCLKGRPMIPKLIHRWLSERVLAYWYMYGGFRVSSGDIVLKLKGGNHEDVEMIAKTLQTKSLACRVKRKGRVFWIGFQGSNAVSFWKLVEPYVLENIKDHLTPYGDTVTNITQEDQNYDFDMESDSDEQRSD